MFLGCFGRQLEVYFDSSNVSVVSCNGRPITGCKIYKLVDEKYIIVGKIIHKENQKTASALNLISYNEGYLNLFDSLEANTEYKVLAVSYNTVDAIFFSTDSYNSINTLDKDCGASSTGQVLTTTAPFCT